MTRWAALIGALALAACAGPRWQKPGVGEAQVSADFSDCSSFAQEAVQRDSNIDADILASRSQDWQNHGTIQMHRTEMASDTGKRSDDMLNACMTAKGYAPLK